MPWSGWGTSVHIPAPLNAPDNPIPFERLKFNPIGLYDLQRRLGVLATSRGIFTQYQHNFLASDHACFAAGCHNNGNHDVPTGEFHPFFKIAREGSTHEKRTSLRKRLVDLLFDVVCAFFSL